MVHICAIYDCSVWKGRGTGEGKGRGERKGREERAIISWVVPPLLIATVNIGLGLVSML